MNAFTRAATRAATASCTTSWILVRMPILASLLVVAFGVDAVAQEHVHHMLVGIHPSHGAREARMTEAGVAHAVAGGSALALHGFVPTQAAAVALATGLQNWHLVNSATTASLR
jgi:hypothetical protein